MKKSDLIFSTILLPVDYLMLILSGIFVYYLRFAALTELRPVIYEIPFGRFFITIIFVALIWLGVFALTGLYALGERRHFSQEFGKIFLASTVGIMLIVLFIFFNGIYFSSRFIILACWIMAIVFVSLGRISVHLIQLLSYRRGMGLEPILIFGRGKIAEEITQNIKTNSGLGYKILDNPLTIDELLIKWQNQASNITQIIQADPNLEQDQALKLIDFCNEHQITLKYIPNVFGTLFSNVRTETFCGLPIISIKRTALEGWGRVIKRFIDIILSGLSLIILSPFFLIIAILIKLNSKGPVFVKLKRVGGRGKEFKLYKFRSMVDNAEFLKKDLMKYNERTGPLFKMKNDPRITKIGKFIRRYSIDELPQLFNVLRGEMSLVGPRPHEPEEVENYQKHHKQLLILKPGITGFAQISGRSALSFEEEAELDIYYIENWSLSLDLQILLKTIPVVLSARDAI